MTSTARSELPQRSDLVCCRLNSRLMCSRKEKWRTIGLEKIIIYLLLGMISRLPPAWTRNWSLHYAGRLWAHVCITVTRPKFDLLVCSVSKLISFQRWQMATQIDLDYSLELHHVNCEEYYWPNSDQRLIPCILFLANTRDRKLYAENMSTLSQMYKSLGKS